MKCHNERVARSRRVKEEKREREKERAALVSSVGRSTSTTSVGDVPLSSPKSRPGTPASSRKHP